MTTKIVVSMSANSVGCTFLDWSILHLSGADTFYSFNDKNFIPLTKDPITTINAHGHKKNHLAGIEANKEQVELFLKNHTGLLTLYPYARSLPTLARAYNIDMDSPEFAHNVETKFKDLMFQDLIDQWYYFDSKQAKIVWIDEDPNLLAFHQNKRTQHGLQDISQKTLQEIDDEFQDLFYRESKQTWSALGLSNIWDERERRALDIRPEKYIMCDSEKEQLIPFELAHLKITTAEWWTLGESVIRRVMDYCDIPINQSRWSSWTSMYKRWQGLIAPQLSFCYRLPIILNAVVHNHYYELGELSFIQEVVIQHYLIYKHNLNLKTWNLTKFPSNALELHGLLETNLHPVADIYNTRSCLSTQT